MKLGLVTYNMAHAWDVPTLIEMCRKTGFQGVELRTTHAHGVEPALSPEARRAVRRQFAESGVTLWGLGSVCDFHSAEAEVVRQNIETCRDFVQLAQDVGARGVKVRPNGLQVDKGIAVEKTLEQIGLALRECGKAAADHGVEIWLEVHGRDTCHPPYIRTILDHCSHPAVGACWNSNMTDVMDGSIREYFDLLAPDIKSVHITELHRENYPWPELFARLNAIGYEGFTLAEIQASSDAETVMNYYRRLWQELSRR